MHKKIILLLLFVQVSLFYGCKENNSPTPDCSKNPVTIHAKAFYGHEPLVLFKDFDYPQGYKLKITRADFMIHGLELTGNTNTLSFKDSVFVLQFTDDNYNSAAKGQALTFGDCKGDFNAIRLAIGVDKETNTKKPSDFPSGHPLANAFYYWDAWKSFIFMKIEGKYDKDGDGNFEGNFAYHIGTDLYAQYTLPVVLKASPDKDNSLDLNFDIKRILTSDTEFIDIPTHPASHNPGDTAVANMLYQNLAKAVTVK